MLIEPIQILLADDDEDDRLFFKEAFEEIKIKTNVRFVNDGVELMNHLKQTGYLLPHILFLDLNMPRKSGIECLLEIKRGNQFQNIAIVIYSIDFYLFSIIGFGGSSYFIMTILSLNLKGFLSRKRSVFR